MEFYCSNNALPNILYIASLLHLHLHSTRMAQLFVFFSSPLSISNHIFIYSTSSHIFPNNSHLLFLWPTLSPIFFLFHPSSSYTVCIDNISKYIIVWKPTLVNSIKSIKSSALIIILCRYFRIFFFNWNDKLTMSRHVFFITETITWPAIYILTFSSRLDVFRTVPKISVRCLRLDFPTQRTSIFFDLCAPNKSRIFCCQTHGKTTMPVLKHEKTL